MDDASRALAILEIQQLKARYMRAVDMRDWDLYASVFTQDIECDFAAMFTALPPGSTDRASASPMYMPEAIFHGLDALLRFVGTSLTGVRSVHHAHAMEIEILSDTSATGIVAFEDILDFPHGQEFFGKPIHTVQGHGHYWETYEKQGGQWKIKALKITRLRVEMR